MIALLHGPSVTGSGYETPRRRSISCRSKSPKPIRPTTEGGHQRSGTRDDGSRRRRPLPEDLFTGKQVARETPFDHVGGQR
jgi:hypothetical protein